MRIFLIMTFSILVGCGNKPEPKKQETLGIAVSTKTVIVIDENGDTIKKSIRTTYVPIPPTEKIQVEIIDPAEQERVYDEWFRNMSWYTPN